MKNAMSNIKNKKGFSLLEMLIVVSIIMTMTMTMFVISFKDRDKKELETVGRSVAAAIRETQNNALTGKQEGTDALPCAFRFMTTGTGFKVQGSFRALNNLCGDDTADPSYTKVFAENDFAKSKITIVGHTDDPDKDSSYIVFVVPHGGYLNAVDKKKGVDFVVESDRVDVKYHVCVHSTGLIEEIGFTKDDFSCDF